MSRVRPVSQLADFSLHLTSKRPVKGEYSPALTRIFFLFFLSFSFLFWDGRRPSDHLQILS
ncbi:hypothetical protein L873DRAFT_1441619 [Choiromyces venosus 120613-1]|uniref:Uncharacterized protein n=1 Tax=Choiromyces venosus 120613-1 TaxID=1336337 RepID=A0A3N4J7L2_9PEZI|nr:hypothetical protein L873DRAFT_1441619 [Choiromyces venosus 120613-1]